jgi:hypothetical protein
LSAGAQTFKSYPVFLQITFKSLTNPSSPFPLTKIIFCFFCVANLINNSNVLVFPEPVVPKTTVPRARAYGLIHIPSSLLRTTPA